MKRLCVLTLLSLFTIAIFAIQAKPGLTKIITLSGGAKVQVSLRGDEYLHYWQADNGTKYIFDSNVNDYKPIDETSLKNNFKSRLMRRSVRKAAKKDLLKDMSQSQFIGKKKGIVILAQFRDVKFGNGHDNVLYNQIVNQSGFNNADGFVGSVKDYFISQSSGRFEVDFDVVGPVTLPNTCAYYGGNDRSGYDLHAGEMVALACQAVVDNVDFADYDWNGDGTVDMVYVLYAGQGEADGGIESTVWPHESELYYSDYNSFLLADGVTINTYACSNEVDGNNHIEGIGTVCHEFSHCLGLPDMYDVNYGGNFGMGNWDLMSSGSYNGNSFVPAGYTAYEKMFCGWQIPVELGNEDQEVTDMQPLSNGGDAYIIYNEGNKNEYYVLENRQKTGWDSALPGAGMLISHVDYDENIWYANMVNTYAFSSYYDVSNDHERLTIFHADNEAGEEVWQQATDAYPYAGNDSLTNNSVPSASIYNDNADGNKMMNRGITSITQNTDGTMSFVFKETSATVLRSTLFYESFNKCNGSGGNDGKWNGSIAKGTLNTDNAGWLTGAVSGGFGADQCARFGTSSSNGNVATPDVILNGNSILSFNVAPWVSAKDGTKLMVWLNGDILLGTYNLAQNQWTSITIPINYTGTCYITFIPDNRFFLDEVLITTDYMGTGISNVIVPPAVENNVYGIDGKYMGADINALPKGIYIVNGKKVLR